MNQKHQNMFHVTLDVNLTAKSIIQSKNGIKINVNVRIKKTKKHGVGKEDCALNPTMCACECDKNSC